MGYQPGEFAVDYSEFTDVLNGGSFSVCQQGNNQLVLAFTNMPEPGTWALLSVGATGLGPVMWRRRHAVSA